MDNKGKKECCNYCKVKGSTFTLKYKGCANTMCECHSTQSSESNYSKLEHLAAQPYEVLSKKIDEAGIAVMTTPSPSLQELIEKKLGEFETKFRKDFPMFYPIEPHKDFLQSAITESYAEGRREERSAIREEAKRRRPILWSDDAAKHNRNIGAYEALEGFIRWLSQDH